MIIEFTFVIVGSSKIRINTIIVYQIFYYIVIFRKLMFILLSMCIYMIMHT